MTRFRVKYERIIDAETIGDAVFEMMLDLFRAMNKSTRENVTIPLEDHISEYIRYEEVND